MGNEQTASFQKHEGSGDIVAGDKHINYNYLLSNTKSQQPPPEIRKVSLKYPSESGLQAELEAQGYKISWSRDEMKAGCEPVIITLDDGTRVMFKDSVSGLTLLKKKVDAQAQSRPAVPHDSQERELVSRTSRELLSFYTPDRTTQESNRLMQPYVGQWIEVSGKVFDVGHGAPDGDQTAVILKDGTDQIECRFRREWENRLDRLAKNESIKIVGKISPTQNGSQLYLQECEIPHQQARN